MGLFDDLLGGGAKSTQAPTDNTQIVTNTTQTNNPVISDPIITSSSQTVTPASIDEMLNISAGNITADMPSYTAQKAAGEAIGPVVESTPMAPNSLFIDSNSADQINILPNNTTTPVTEVNSPIIISETTITPEVTATTSASTPVISSSSDVTSTVTEGVMPIILTETPITTTSEAIQTPVTNTIITEKTEGSEEKINEIVAKTPFVDIFANTNEKADTSVVVENSVAEETQDFNLFQMTNGGSNEDSNQIVSQESAPIVTEIEKPSETIASSTADFIATSLAQLAAMKLTLNGRKQEFLDKAAVYRAEKEKFAKLEEGALADSVSMDEEYARIEIMEEYFEKQKNNTSSKNSTDTMSINNETGNVTDKNTEKKSTRKTTKATA